MSSNSIDFDPGAELGGYVILRRLGAGGMSVVFEAQDPKLDRTVALKVLRPHLAADPIQVRRFEHEAKAAAMLVHPNIVQTFDVGEAGEYRFIAQEFVAGANLSRMLQQRTKIPPATVVSIMRQVALALHKAAEHNIIHRDIKPENILVTPRGEAKVADFGLARISSDDHDAVRQTQPGMVLGTPLYMSPEQVEDRELDHRSDLYSLGVTAYHLLAGKPPFDGKTPLQVAYHHLHTQPPKLSDTADTPLSLSKLVDRLLEKQPKDRFAGAGELLDSLREVASEHAEQWPENPQSWLAAEQLEHTEATSAATRRLQLAMQSGADNAAPRRRLVKSWLSALVILTGSAGIGAIAAWWNRPQPLLSRAASPAIDRLESMEQQYTHAVIVGTEAALRAVWMEHEPNNAHETRLAYLAKRRLAQLLISERRYDEAQPLLDELSALPETEMEFVAFGALGQAQIAWEREATEEAAIHITRALKSLQLLSEEQRAGLLAGFTPDLQQRISQRLSE